MSDNSGAQQRDNAVSLGPAEEELIRQYGNARLARSGPADAYDVLTRPSRPDPAVGVLSLAEWRDPRDPGRLSRNAAAGAFTAALEDFAPDDLGILITSGADVVVKRIVTKLEPALTALLLQGRQPDEVADVLDAVVLDVARPILVALPADLSGAALAEIATTGGDVPKAGALFLGLGGAGTKVLEELVRLDPATAGAITQQLPQDMQLQLLKGLADDVAALLAPHLGAADLAQALITVPPARAVTLVQLTLAQDDHAVARALHALGWADGVELIKQLPRRELGVLVQAMWGEHEAYTKDVVDHLPHGRRKELESDLVDPARSGLGF